VGFCSGTIAGLVAATPACGFIPPWASFIMGVVAGCLCNVGTKLKFYLGVDDALDLTAEHAIGGIIGLLANGFFGTKAVISLDDVNTSVVGGFLDSNWRQMYIQAAYIAATVGYTFVVTVLIAKAIDMIPGLQLRSTEQDEALGMDDVEIGEFANDYIELRREYSDWTSPADKLSGNMGEKRSEPIRVHVTAADRQKQPNPDLYTHSQMKLHANPSDSHPPCCDILHSAIALANSRQSYCASHHTKPSTERHLQPDMFAIEEKNLDDPKSFRTSSET